MTIYNPTRTDPAARPARLLGASGIVLALLVAGCDVEWGGASIRLENPAPEPEPAVESGAVAVEAPPAPLPEGPLLFEVSIDPASGHARAFPFARLGERGPEPIALPESWDDAWRARFDSAFLAEGRALELHAGGRRIGSLVLDGRTRAPRARCLPVALGRALLPAGSKAPERAYALASVGTPGEPAAPARFEVDNRIRTFGPILAEQLMRAGGERRPFLAQRADIQAVDWPGDSQPAMAATYLINDGPDGPAPAGDATSLFFLARFDPARGYVPEWSELRRYGGGEGKELFVYRGAVDGPSGRIDFVERRDGSSIRLAASPDVEGRRSITWTEAESCPSDGILAEAAGG
ncbi:MAG: hypothetical protein R6X22_02805 [Gemmatimonadota bacterium]